MISLQRTVDLCFCQMLSRTKWVQNGGGNIFKNLWKVSNESNTQSTTWMPENWIWGQVWLHCTVSGVLHTQEHLETTLYCLRSIAHPWALTNYTVLSPEYCTPKNTYKLHCTISSVLHTYKHLQTLGKISLNYLSQLLYLRPSALYSSTFFLLRF